MIKFLQTLFGKKETNSDKINLSNTGTLYIENDSPRKFTYEEFRKNAASLYMTGDYDEALFEINEAIQLQPNEATAYHTRGSIHYKLGKIREAKEDWEKSLQLGNSQAQEMLTKYFK